MEIPFFPPNSLAIILVTLVAATQLINRTVDVRSRFSK